MSELVTTASLKKKEEISPTFWAFGNIQDGIEIETYFMLNMFWFPNSYSIKLTMINIKSNLGYRKIQEADANMNQIVLIKQGMRMLNI